MHVVIIGGGIGGLCLAQGLKKNGISCSLFERDSTPTARLQGYRVHIDALDSLKGCLEPQLYDKFLKTCSNENQAQFSFRVLDEKLQQIGKIIFPKGAEKHKVVSRLTLRQVLLEGLEDIVHFNKRFTHYEVAEANHKVIAYFNDGTTATGDILVGADGGNSVVRHQLLPHAKRMDTGYTSVGAKLLYEKITEILPNEMIDSGMHMVCAPHGWCLFMTGYRVDSSNPVVNELKSKLHLQNIPSDLKWGIDKSYWMLAVSAKKEKWGLGQNGLENMTPEQIIDLLKEKTKSWHPAFRRMLDEVDTATVSAFELYSSERVSPWDSGRVTLVGDAIHSMTPFRGTGGNQAINDAHKLTEALVAASRGEIPLLNGIHGYEVEMLDRGFKWVDKSLQSLYMVTTESWSMIAIRNMVFKMLTWYTKLPIGKA